MAERNSPTEEGDVSESTSAAYRLLSYAYDVVVSAPTRREFAEESKGDDVLEIEYQSKKGLEEASEEHSPEKLRGHESNRGAARTVRFAEVQEPMQGRIGRRRRRRFTSSRKRRQARMVNSSERQRGQSAQPEVHQSCRVAIQQPPSPQQVISEPEEGEEYPLARDPGGAEAQDVPCQPTLAADEEDHLGRGN